MAWLFLLLVLLGPLAFVWFQHHPRRLIYRGEATAILRYKYIDPTGRFGWLIINVPEAGHMVAHLSAARAKRLPDDQNAKVEVEVYATKLSAPWIDRVRWCRDKDWEKATNPGSVANALLTTYLCIAGAALLFATWLSALVVAAFGAGVYGWVRWRYRSIPESCGCEGGTL